MAYRWRIVCQVVGFLDFYFSTLAVLFYIWATWYLSNEISRRGPLMVLIAIGAFVAALFKMSGIWTSCKLIAVTNSEDEDCRIAHEVAWTWLKASATLMFTSVLTLGAILLVFWGCSGCAGVAGGYVIINVILLLLGCLHVKELTTAVTENAHLLAQLNP